jgi:hypothetical protein
MQVRRTLPTENIPRPREEEVAAGDSNTYKSVTFDVSPDDGEGDLEIVRLFSLVPLGTRYR